MDDAQLLSTYVTQHSEEAFATLVERYISLVYSSALRQVGDPHLAEEITQAVFILLAQKARSLREESVLAGWLCRTAHFAARNALKIERRRQLREQEAYMNSLLNEPEPEYWTQIMPLLDEAVAELSKADRDALVMRFYQQKSLSEVGLALGLSEDSAQKRVSRALQKLHKLFVKRGVTISAAAIASTVMANSVHAAPAGLATAVTAAAAKGTVVSGSTLTIIKGVSKIMAWTKAKVAVAVGVGILLAAGTTAITVKQIEEHRADDWQKAWHGAAMVDKAPPQTTIRQSPASRSASVSDYANIGVKIIGLGRRFNEMVADIFNTDKEHLIVSSSVPEGRFDYLANKPNVSGVACIIDEIQKKFDLTVRRQFYETNALVLTLKNRKAPGLKLCSDTSYQQGPVRTESSLMSYGGMWKFVIGLEESLGTIVVDGTGLSEQFDINLEWDGTSEGLKKALREEMGMELVPSQKPVAVPMFVVEKAKPVKYPFLKQNIVVDFKLDGTVHYELTAEDINRTEETIFKDYIGEDLPIVRITDETGQPVAFTNQMGVIVMTLNKPVPAGMKYSYTISLTVPRWSQPRNKAGEFEWQLESSLYEFCDSRSIEEYRLPPGAELISTQPGELKKSTKDGRIVLQTERMIPRGGTRLSNLRYRIPAAAK